MDTSKEEIVNLRKQINRLKISLMFTQVLMIALLLILGYVFKSSNRPSKPSELNSNFI